MSPGYKSPLKGAPAPLRAFRIGATTFSPTFSMSSGYTHGSGAIVPTPPVLGPLSPSKILLWSCEEGKSLNTFPSVKACAENSFPCRNSSITTLAPDAPNTFSTIIFRNASSASSSVAAIVTPFPNASPSAFITIGNNCCSTYFLASSKSSKVLKVAVGIPFSCINFFANPFEDSIRAAAFVGPKIFNPFAVNASTIPIASGSSEATTVISISFSSANCTSAGISVEAMGTFSATFPVPPFPGAIYSFSTRGDCESFHASACSRA